MTPHEQRCKKCQTDKSRCSWRGKSREVVEGEVSITHKRSKGELATQGDEVQVVEVPRGKLLAVIPLFAADKTQWNP
jgi:hypothetical protein